MENFENKYNNALSMIKEIHTLLAGEARQRLEKAFPELAEPESGDERIRGAIIDHLRDFNLTEWANWLEKQGERTSSQTNERAWLYLVSDVLTWKDGIGQYLDDPRVQELAKKLCSEYAQKLYNSPIYSNSSNIGNNKHKPDDRVEPKFKVKDWIVDKSGLAQQVLDFRGGIYTCTYNSFTTDCESNYHLWTIQDAKDGDVLINKNYMGENPFIFKEIKSSNIKTNVLNPLTVLGYCGIGGAGFTKSNGWGDTANCVYYPATKEQRSTLFTKMKEAGYEWDAEKKELKKIAVPKFEAGDIIRRVSGNGFTWLIEEVSESCYFTRCQNETSCIKFENQDDWELVEPKQELTEFEKAVGVAIGSWHPMPASR